MTYILVLKKNSLGSLGKDSWMTIFPTWGLNYLICEKLVSVTNKQYIERRKCVFVCFLFEFTVELTAHHLHAQGAGLATHHRDNADILGNDRGVKQVGLGAVVVHVSNKYLQRKEELVNCVVCAINLLFRLVSDTYH